MELDQHCICHKWPAIPHSQVPGWFCDTEDYCLMIARLLGPRGAFFQPGQNLVSLLTLPIFFSQILA